MEKERNTLENTVEVRFWHGHVWLPKKVGSPKLDEYCKTDWTMLHSANG